MAFFSETILGTNSRFCIFSKIWKKKNMVNSNAIFNGFFYAIII